VQHGCPKGARPIKNVPSDFKRVHRHQKIRMKKALTFKARLLFDPPVSGETPDLRNLV